MGKWSFCPPGTVLQGLSWMGHKSKSTNCIRLKFCINPKVQTASGWNFVFCPLILKCITGKKNQEILRWWVANLSFFGDLRRNYPQHIFSIVADLLQSTPSEDCLLIRKNTRLEIMKTVELKNVVLLVMKNM